MTSNEKDLMSEFPELLLGRAKSLVVVHMGALGVVLLVIKIDSFSVSVHVF